jgi:hypothetical protein
LLSSEKCSALPLDGACSPDAVTASDLEGRITAVSRRGVELNGAVDEADLLGRSAFGSLSGRHERALANLALTPERGVIGRSVP